MEPDHRSGDWLGRQMSAMSRQTIPRIHLAIAGMVIAFLLAITAAAASLIWQQHQDAITNSASQANRFVTGAVAALNRTMVDLDVLLASLDESENLSALQPDEIDHRVTKKTLRGIVKRNLMLRRLALVDENSRVLVSSSLVDNDPLVIPEDFAKRALNVNVAALTMSAPQLDSASLEPVILLSRHIKLANGTRILVVAEVLLMHFNTIMVQGADIPGLEVTLERRDGQLLISNPVQDKLSGKILSHPMGKHTGTTQFMPARLSGQDALVVAEPILYDDLLIVAGIPMQAALSKWQKDRKLILIAAALFALMVVVAGGFASWYLHRLAQARLAVKQSRDEIEHLAFYDHLTNLPNRLLLMDRLGQALTSSQRHKRMGAMLFLDLDNFKTINDTLGHDVGDLLLKEVASRLKASVRSMDSVARFGGDEFIVLLEDLSTNSLESADLARHIGEKILAILAMPFTSGEQIFKCSASIGAAIFGDSPILSSELLKQADIAMYQAKSMGRNKLCFFDPLMQASITARADLERDLLAAVAQEQFMLYFQPQVTQGGHVIGAEVLIRWQHPLRGMVPPFEFIPIAEESDLINLIGLWVLRTACGQLRTWQQSSATAQLQLAVNVSAKQFLQANFVDQVRHVVQESGIEPNGLKLELTESLVLDNVDDTIAKMSELKAMGVRFSMDDFGTGQSSLSYLTRLPLDQLKIDQSFVRNIGIKPSDGMIVQTIIGMARNLALEVIAEGVETVEQQQFLAEHGCTLYQGYLFGKPTPLAGFETLLAEHLTHS
jgi:diguanylate cyclase (GGDEF)-like protein